MMALLLTSILAGALQGRGWKVVVLSLPAPMLSNHAPLPEGIHRVILEDLSEERLQLFWLRLPLTLDP